MGASNQAILVLGGAFGLLMVFMFLGLLGLYYGPVILKKIKRRHEDK